MKHLTAILILAFISTTSFAQSSVGKSFAATWQNSQSGDAFGKIELSWVRDSLFYVISRGGKTFQKGTTTTPTANSVQIAFDKKNSAYEFNLSFNPKAPNELKVQRVIRNEKTGKRSAKTHRYNRGGKTKRTGTGKIQEKLIVSLESCKNCKQYRIQLIGKNFKKSLVPNSKGIVVFKNIPIQNYKARVIWNQKGNKNKTPFKVRAINLKDLEAEDRLGNFEIQDLM